MSLGPDIEIGFLDGISLWMWVIAAAVGLLLLSNPFSRSLILWILLVTLAVGALWFTLKKLQEYLFGGRQTKGTGGYDQ